MGAEINGAWGGPAPEHRPDLQHFKLHDPVWGAGRKVKYTPKEEFKRPDPDAGVQYSSYRSPLTPRGAITLCS